LKEMHLEARKTIKKMGRCSNCKQTKERALLMVCGIVDAESISIVRGRVKWHSGLSTSAFVTPMSELIKNNRQRAELCLVCRWNYGNGRKYLPSLRILSCCVQCIAKSQWMRELGCISPEGKCGM